MVWAATGQLSWLEEQTIVFALWAVEALAVIELVWIYQDPTLTSYWFGLE